MHKFREGDTVVSKEDFNDFLPAGSHGTVFCVYETVPPAYEINFVDIGGQRFGAIRYEDEIEALHLAPAPRQTSASAV